MTKNKYGGHQDEGSYYPPQPEYGQQSYGNYSSGEEQGSAQSYYGANNQPYQQYSHDRPMNPPQDQYYQGRQAPSYTPAPQQYGTQFDRQFGGESWHQETHPPQQEPPRYAQEYPHHPIQYPSAEVNDFRSHFDQPYAQPNAQGHYTQPPGYYPPEASVPPEGDRGVMGALAGGAAGAYGGHKINHGILGGIGGAVAGSFLEDAYKKKHKKNKKPKSRRGSSSSSSSSSVDDKKKRHGGGVAAAGNFRASARNVHMDGRCTLVAECTNINGHHQHSAMDLNDVFTNMNGRLHWARGGNFAASARNIRLSENGNCIEAELGDGRGGWQHNKVNLNERISNDDGRLVLL